MPEGTVWWSAQLQDQTTEWIEVARGQLEMEPQQVSTVLPRMSSEVRFTYTQVVDGLEGDSILQYVSLIPETSKEPFSLEKELEGYSEAWTASFMLALSIKPPTALASLIDMLPETAKSTTVLQLLMIESRENSRTAEILALLPALQPDARQ